MGGAAAISPGAAASLLAHETGKPNQFIWRLSGGETGPYQRYAERSVGDGVEGRLVSMHTFNEPWDSWEVHPHGEELVVCTEGAITLLQEIGGGVRTVDMRAGDAIVNPSGVWHAADVVGTATALFITAGMGTENRPR